MRGSAIAEGTGKKSKLTFSLFISKAKSFKHSFLEDFLMNTDGSPSYLGAINHTIVCICSYPGRIRFEVLSIFNFGTGERMVHGIKPLIFLIPFKQGKINNPQRFENIFFPKAQAVAHFEPQFTKRFKSCRFFSCQNKDKVSWCCACRLSYAKQFFR